jgi:hypothetical protein
MSIIEDGKGSGKKVGVSASGRLEVVAVSESVQHAISFLAQQAYQVIGTVTLSSGTTTALHIRNNSPSESIIVTYVRHQILGSSGGTAFATSDNNYYRIAFGRTYESGGIEVDPININTASNNEAAVTVYTDNPTLAGTALEIDRWYTKEDGDMNVFNKEASVVLGQGGTMELSYVGDKTAGTFYTRLSFGMKRPG